MRLGLLITSIGNFGQKGFYNAQEIGLAKELDKIFEEVIVYKAIHHTQARESTILEACKNTTLHQIPVKSVGINGLWNCNDLDDSLDVLIYFSDTQIMVPKIYKWCQAKSVSFIPYIGVVKSHSVNKLKKTIMDALFYRNVQVYRKCTCLVKTPAVQAALGLKGVSNCIVAPVGLDVTLLCENYLEVSEKDLKKRWGYEEKDKVILYIGRLTDEKQPVRMIRCFAKIFQKDNNYRLLMVGKGELRGAVEQAINTNGVQEYVRLVEQIPNSEIWQLYRMADCFVNLNQQEIFGMAILEAMYYGCKVVAWRAPGPDFIIRNGISGCLVKSDEESIKCIMEEQFGSEVIHKEIVDGFTWEHTARKIEEVVRNKKRVWL